MDSYKYTREEDRVQPEGNLERPIDVTPLLGDWRNTNTGSKGISRVVLTKDGGGGLTIAVFGSCDGSPQSWGEVKIDAVYAKGAGSLDPMGFQARYDFDFMETRLDANLSLGLLVIAGLNTFKDSSGRSNYFSREFFHQ